MTPMIIRETSNGFHKFSIQEDMLSRREVECVGTIDADSAYSLTRQLRFLEQEDDQAEITLLINSPGGEVSSGLAVYDVMKGLRCPVRTVCLGTAASMAAVLFAAGSRREIMPHGKVMIHDPLISNSLGGSALQVQSISRNLLNTRDILGDILSACTGRSKKEIYRKTAKDTYFSAEEAVKFGLADAVIHHV